MRMPVVLAIAAAAVVRLAAGLTAGDAVDRQSPPAPQTVFRGGVDYVAVDVVVTGRGDKPIATWCSRSSSDSQPVKQE